MNPEEYQRMFDLEDHYWWFVARRNLALKLLSRFGKESGRILDLGCGTGAVLQELTKNSNDVVGIDFSNLALKFARSRQPFKLVRGDGTQLPIQSNSFDAIVCLDVFEHIDNDVKAFGECYRILKPGGILILSVPAFQSLWSPHDVALHHFRRYRKQNLQSKLRNQNYKVLKQSYSIFLLFPAVLTVRLFEKLFRSNPKASLPQFSEAWNRTLVKIQTAEMKILLKTNLPWGSSVVAVAQKPAP